MTATRNNPFLRDKPAPDDVPERGRRDVLRALAAGVGLALAPGVTLYAFGGPAEARAPGDPVSSKVRWGLLIDVNKCADGCTRCVTACSTENGWSDTGHPLTDAQWIRKVKVTDPKTGASRSLPVMCQHCAEPPCVDVCPTGASFKRADGIVLVDKHICIGCRYCMMACPYNARSFIHESLKDQKPYAPRGKGTVESCTLCVHRIDAGRIPACVEACPAEGGGALAFGDLNDPAAEISQRIAKYASAQIRADLGTDPGVRYQNL
ncbi:MAG TPA: 4Fe-4S dicluster domain-containing protein [Rhizobiales bacterium]|nr:tetrathionate reductase subunit B precursor [bacterium BMS3Bbin10]HDO51417.1 4Fe-4S dicluster domain-containing protein [Hyphomicrobiales bacterium]